MFSNLSSWFYGSSPAEKTDEVVAEPSPDALIEVDENFEPIEIDESDDWVILGKGDTEADPKKTDDEGMVAERHSRSSSACQNEEGWFVTPPPCFTSVGPADMETTPLENLLIEHPSMSVYHSPTVSSVLPEKRTLASIASNNESFDDETPIVFEAIKLKNRLPKQQKKKAFKKSVPLDEFKMAPEKILGTVPASVSAPIAVDVAKKLERSNVEMFPVLSPSSNSKVSSQRAVRSYNEVAASLKRRQPKTEVLETVKHVKIAPEIKVDNKPKPVSPVEEVQAPVKVSTTPKNVLKKGRKPPNPLPHLVKDELKKIPKEIVPKMRAQEQRLVRLSSFSVIQSSDLPKSSKMLKKEISKPVEVQQETINNVVTSAVEVRKPVVVDCEEKKKRKAQRKSVVKQAKIEKVEDNDSTSSQVTMATQTTVVRPKCEVVEKRDQKSPVKKENILIPLTTSIALNSLVSRPEENAYKHELLKRELAMIAGTTKAQKLQAHRETRILCRNQLAHINRVSIMLSASNKRLRRADKNMRPSGANNNRKCC
ncbi:titin [Adelges cooleyi]|uniref:titin n=1 Tax=Adelges cooleyi TaxID=133065 RepID=UPI0021804846|nr:titin [Adelges cooleyi]XP_050443718.1 titin [Adelges cooleyi]